MRSAIKISFLFLAIFSLSALTPGFTALEVNLPANQNFVLDDEDETPEVTDRVARVSFIEGEAKIRRKGSDEWEQVTLNLPLVEGDEIATDAFTRVEIQFNKDKHLRLDGSSYLRLATLKDEGVAVSLSLGKLSFLATSFDRDRAFFEIDAPKVTVAVQRAGRYFVDAGERGDVEVKVAIDEGGEARVYSDNAGFTLKNDRTARVFTDGANAGEWTTTAGVSMSDDFASWLEDREETVARRLRNSHYDRYYDQDIYGADDLSDNGDWVNTDDYGYVWRPSRLATAQYSNWSPYRYGHWRWMSPYGWIWVNDEPWGWATYHHGRWFNYRGNWVWSPYGYYRARRSWWSPALVVINVYNNNVCWYPLSYHRRRHNFNAHYQKKRERNVIGRTPRITPPLPTGNPGTGKIRNGKDPIGDILPGGVVTTNTKDFGNRNMRVATAPEPIAKTVFIDMPDENSQPLLPDYQQKRRSLDVVTERPKVEPAPVTRIGAGPKRSGGSLDGELQKTRIFGGRTTQKQPETEIKEPTVRPSEPRKTGVFDRPPTVVRQPVETKAPEREPEVVRMPPPRKQEPVFTPPERQEKPRNTQPVREIPRYDPPPVKQQPRSDPPPTKQQPRSDPPTPKSEPKQETRQVPSRKEKPDSN